MVEELIEYGRPFNLGLEAGSKPELLVALALQENPEALILCNGYKDRAYIETALLAQKLGRKVIIVVDRVAEVDTIIAACRELGIRPIIGVRARLATKGAGKWVESTGDRSKFGLTTARWWARSRSCAAEGMLDCLQLLHFHIGSQITAIRAIKDALREASRIFVELHGLGANMRYLDCGGGLGVDYDGSQTNFHSSVNYTLQEYAADVVSQVAEACNAKGVPHPDIVTESGRALTAHHSVLVFNVLDTNQMLLGPDPGVAGQGRAPRHPAALRDLPGRLAQELPGGVPRRAAPQGGGHHRLQPGPPGPEGARARRAALLRHHREDPEDRARPALRARRAGGAGEAALRHLLLQLLALPVAARPLGGAPALPHHADRPPEQAARPGGPILADLTCDSDGKMDQFIDLRDVKHFLELHPLNGEPYYVASFLVGAYQEILGDLHNLFGDTDAVHVKVHGDDYGVEHVVEGDSVAEVLSYVQYSKDDLMSRVRRAVETALRERRLTPAESGRLMRRYEEALEGYTYLTVNT